MNYYTLWFVKACWIVAMIGVVVGVLFYLLLDSKFYLFNAVLGMVIAIIYTIWVS